MVSREELYRLVWSEPMSKLATRFGVSGSYLARVCSLLNVPRPERGYWAKLEYGKAPAQTPLPEPRPGDPLHWSKDGSPVPASHPKAPPRRKAPAKVRIPRSEIHGLIRGAKSHFINGRPVDEGAYLKPYKRLLVDVTASQSCLDRALDLANNLFNGLESVGHRVVIAPAGANLGRTRIDEREGNPKPRDHWEYRGLWSPDRPTVAYVGTVPIGLAVIEMSENVLLRYVGGKYIRDSDYVPPRRRDEYSWTTRGDIPSGRLRIVAYSPYRRASWSMHWQESKSATLASQLRAIIGAIENAAPELVTRLEEADREAAIRWKQYEEEQERRRRDEDREKIAKSIVDSKSDLRDVIRKWSEVMDIERFLAGVEKSASGLSDDERKPVLDRLALARSFLGTQDPLDFLRGWKTPAELYSPRYPDSPSQEE
jgi:hypothetical protein